MQTMICEEQRLNERLYRYIHQLSLNRFELPHSSKISYLFCMREVLMSSKMYQNRAAKKRKNNQRVRIILIKSALLPEKLRVDVQYERQALRRTVFFSPSHLRVTAQD